MKSCSLRAQAPIFRHNHVFTPTLSGLSRSRPNKYDHRFTGSQANAKIKAGLEIRSMQRAIILFIPFSPSCILHNQCFKSGKGLKIQACTCSIRLLEISHMSYDIILQIMFSSFGLFRSELSKRVEKTHNQGQSFATSSYPNIVIRRERNIPSILCRIRIHYGSKRILSTILTSHTGASYHNFQHLKCTSKQGLVLVAQQF